MTRTVGTMRRDYEMKWVNQPKVENMWSFAQQTPNCTHKVRSNYVARFYSPTLGRFTQPDSIVPDATNSQAWNRYSYVNNSPILYVDPSGHYMEQACGFGGGDCGSVGNIPENSDLSNGSLGLDKMDSKEDELEKDIEGTEGGGDNNSPTIYETDDLVIIYMPPGYGGLQRSDFWEKFGLALSIGGFATDIFEFLLIFTPTIGGEDAMAGTDVGITYLASWSSGDSLFFQQPHPDAPYVISANQDVMITVADFVAALGVKATGIATEGVGYAVGLGVDAVTTAGSAVYDYNRVFGDLPNYVSVGVSVSLDSTFGKSVIIVYP